MASNGRDHLPGISRWCNDRQVPVMLAVLSGAALKVLVLGSLVGASCVLQLPSEPSRDVVAVPRESLSSAHDGSDLLGTALGLASCSGDP
jgi:hypothetical protein